MPNSRHAEPYKDGSIHVWYTYTDTLKVVDVCLSHDGDIKMSNRSLASSWSHEWASAEAPQHDGGIYLAKVYTRKNGPAAGDVKQIKVYSSRYDGETLTSPQFPCVLNIPADLHCSQGGVVAFDALRGRFILQSPYMLHVLEIVSRVCVCATTLPLSNLPTVHRFLVSQVFDFGNKRAKSFQPV